MKCADTTYSDAGYVSSPNRLAFVRYDVPVGGVSKRFFDILISVLLLILLAPLMLGLAMLILTTSKGSAFFGHERIGYENRRFQCLKFRTMVIDGDAVLKSHCARNPEALREWTENRKLSSDPRVTPVGQVLRKLSLDELPQLVNVVRGEMSLVGPRPVSLDELQRYGRSVRFYLRARPGITGLWQVSGRSAINYSRRVAIDRMYVTRSKPLTDLYILAMTVPAVIRTEQTS